MTVVGDYRTHAAFNPNAMSLYRAWNRYIPDSSGRNAHLGRLTIARGEALFNGKPIQIRNVKWKDIGRFKGPVLRSLSSRAPYFHDGSAKDLKEVVEFYNTRFGIGFTNDEKRDLIAFLRALKFLRNQ